MATNICKYEDCEREVNHPHDSEYCIFHAPVEKKGVTGERFNQLIERQIKNGDFNFQGYIFPVFIDFSKYNKELGEAKEIDFSHAQFHGYKQVTRTIEILRNETENGEEIKKRELELDLCCDFSNIEFSGFVTFETAVFHHDALFYKTQWEGLKKNNKTYYIYRANEK